MDLAGQGDFASPGPDRTELDDHGYILAVLLIGMAIVAVWMAAALPAWRQQAQRQRELDLIFRGEQYARAVALYVMKNNCALPTNFDDLVTQHYLRKKWKDPITNDDFVVIPGAQPGQQGAGGSPVQGGPGRGSTPTPGNAPTTGRPGGSAPSSNLGAPAGRSGGVPATGSPFGPNSNQQQGGGGIAGVMSKSEGSSIIVYNGQQTYNGWQFLYQSQLQKMGQTPQCGPNGGGNGQGGRNTGPGGRNGQPGAPGTTGAPPPGRGRDGGPGPGRGPGRDGTPPGPTIGRIGRGGEK
jgi:type II secretory pathway pseudopilin PulG